MTDDERTYLLERCLRLEAELARALGLSSEILLPAIERRSLYDAPKSIVLPLLWPTRPPQYRTTPDDVARMREMHNEGLSYREIGRRMRCAATTVARVTRKEIV